MITARLYIPRIHKMITAMANVFAFKGTYEASGGLSRAILP